MRMRSGPVRTLVILSLLAIGPGISAQPSERLYRVGWLYGGSPPAWTFPPAEAFRQGLHDREYVEGRNLVFELRYAEGRFDRFPELAADLVQQRVDIIFAAGDQAIKAAKQATSTIPIVMVACDAVAAGLIDSLARPGGNVSGVTCVSVDIAGKRVELLRDLLGRVTRVAVLYNANDPGKAIEVLDVTQLPPTQEFDLITTFDSIHDQRDPATTLGRIAEALAPGGIYFMVEPRAATKLEDNRGNPFAPYLYGISVLHCMTVSLAEGGAGLGTAWGEELARRMLGEAGFGMVEVVEAPGPQNSIYICRK
jgi:SAM-dependent methyltransferase